MDGSHTARLAVMVANAWNRLGAAYRFHAAGDCQFYGDVVTPALAFARTPPLWLLASLAATAALWPAVKPQTPATTGLPWILCSTSSEAATPRPRPVVKTLRSEPLTGMRGKYVTTQLVHLPPSAFSPRHVHGGDLTAYVLTGTVRSEHAGLAPANYRAGEMFYEPYGTTHVFIENPSSTEAADVLAVMVHDEGAPLTTFLD